MNLTSLFFAIHMPLLHFVLEGSIFSPFEEPVTPLMNTKKIEFYQYDQTISFVVQMNSSIQHLKHLTAFIAILCRFYIF